MTPLRRLQLAVSVLALAAVAVHHSWPGFRADAFTGTFVLVAVLPWLAPILKVVKLPGGFEVELRELRSELEQTKGAVESATRQAQVGAAAAVAAPPRAGAAGALRTPSSLDALLGLGAEYEQVRSGMPQGAARTEAMTQVLTRMFVVANALPEADVRSLLTSASPGQRLAAIAYAHEHPRAEFAESLVLALGDVEDTPFGQYWMLRALRRIAGVARGSFAGPLAQRIGAYRARQRPGTDRFYEATQLLAEVGAPRALPDDDPYGF